MARKIEVKSPQELKGIERVFRIDRDTYLVYTGLHKDDIRPFVRIGSGSYAPAGLLKHIENVVIPESDPPNLGLEIAWLHTTLESGGENIRYVGSRERVSQIYGYTGVSESNDDDKKTTVQMAPYQPFKPDIAKDRSTTTFFSTGDVMVSVGGSRVMNFERTKKQALHIDREYDLITTALSKRKRKCESGLSFLFLGDAVGQMLPTYWNFHGQGLLANPGLDYHYRLFENSIDPAKMTMALAGSIYNPGLIEAIRRKNAEKKTVGIYSPNLDRVGVLKRFYSNVGVKTFDDGRPLPFAKEMTLYISRGGSHGVFAGKLKHEAERMVQILFPIGSGKFSKSFEYIRGPHDLELASLMSLEDKREGRLVLHLPGEVPDAKYRSARLEEGSYPLLQEKEHHLAYSDQPRGFLEEFVKGLEGTNFEAPMRDLLYLCAAADVDEKDLAKKLKEFLKFPVPEGPALFGNLCESLRYLSDLPPFAEGSSLTNRKLIEKLRKKYRISKLRNRDWLSLAQRPVEFSVLFLGGRKTYLLVKAAAAEVVRFVVPPSVRVLEQDDKPYRQLLRQQMKALDKAGNPAGYSQSVDMIEKLLEERMKIVDERLRLYSILDQLYISIQPRVQEEEPSNPLLYWIKKAYTTVREKLSPVIERIREMRAAMWIVFGLALLAGIYGITRLSYGSGPDLITRAGNLVSPGSIQKDEVIPGENEIIPEGTEVYYYADALATANGFSGVTAPHQRDLRDPDLVFPGDTLKLPDGRLVNIAQGESLWQVATTHYRKDAARLAILEKQISSMDDDEKKKTG